MHWERGSHFLRAGRAESEYNGKRPGAIAAKDCVYGFVAP